jgi:uncharacterized membrane protein (UPF0127 family)
MSFKPHGRTTSVALSQVDARRAWDSKSRTSSIGYTTRLDIFMKRGPRHSLRQRWSALGTDVPARGRFVFIQVRDALGISPAVDGGGVFLDAEAGSLWTGRIEMALRMRLWPLAWAALASAGCQGPPPPVALTVAGHPMVAEVALTPAQRATGLMGRTHLDANAGMLFVFPEPGRHCMWMKDTLIPLSVAFLDRDGRILNVAEMRPGSLDQHCAAAPAHYALEANPGWFAGHGAAPGARVEGLAPGSR